MSEDAPGDHRKQTYKLIGMIQLGSGPLMIGLALLLPRFLGEENLLIQGVIGAFGMAEMIAGAIFMKMGTEPERR